MLVRKPKDSLTGKRKHVEKIGPVPHRFMSSCYPNVYRITRMLGEHTFEVEDIADPEAPLRFRNRLSADRLIRLDMPELDLHSDQCRVIEVHNPVTDAWRRAVIEKFSVDGRAQLRWSDDRQITEWADLTRMRYRWVATRSELPPPPQPPPVEAELP